MSRLRCDNITLGYGETSVIDAFNLAVPAWQITTIIGPNGCGKSTLLRALARLKRPSSGSVILDGQLIHHLPTQDVAKRLGLLAQQSMPPSGITVEDVIRRGRFPHQGFMQPPSAEDAEAVSRALALAGLTELRARPIDELSDGQRQRVWIAMVLAQETPILLLDEPTTFLDLAAQIELLDLVRALNRERGRSVVMVLHDLTLAARYADHLVAMKDGQLYAAGSPAEVITEQLLHDVFGIESMIVKDSVTGAPLVLPESTGDRARAEAA